MIEVISKAARRDFAELMDAIERGEHVRITRRSHRTGVLVPEEWHADADRALVIVRGLTQLGTHGTDVRHFMDFVARPPTVSPDEIALLKTRASRPTMSPPLIPATAEDVRLRFAGLMDDIDRGEHVRITRRSHRTGVLVPEEWHADADRALAIVRGLTQLDTHGTDVQQCFAAVLRGIAVRAGQIDLFEEEGMAKAS